MLNLEDCEHRYAEDWETIDWLKSVLNTLSKSQFPRLKENLDCLPDSELNNILGGILQEAEQHDFIANDELLIRYAMWGVNHPQQQMPINQPTSRAALHANDTSDTSETVEMAILDQLDIADWAIRARDLFGYIRK